MKNKILVGIIQLNYGNISSIQNAFRYLKIKSNVVKKPKDLFNCSHVVIPGVGSFKEAVKTLKKKGWSKAIIEYSKLKKPILGICLGMQLLFKSSTEEGYSRGLDLIEGDCKKFKFKNNYSIPHAGFNFVNFDKKIKIFKDIPNNSPFYFIHSFRIKKTSKKYLSGTTIYGEKFLSVVENKKIIGVQFHPEKSHKYGLQLLKNFITEY